MGHQARNRRSGRIGAGGIFVGVDTHRDAHVVGILDEHGREVAAQRFPTTSIGYRDLEGWVSGHGRVIRAAVEGTSSYGAGITRVLVAAGWDVRETVPGDKVDRRLRGKSDTADAFTAARAAMSERARAIPKTGTGPVAAIRVLQQHRRLLVQQQTQLMNQLKAFLITGPAEVREQWQGRTRLGLARGLAATRGNQTTTIDADQPETLATALTLDVLADIATRWLELRARTAALHHQLTSLLRQTAPTLMAVHGVGADVAARLLIAVGDNPERIRSEAALAHLFGIAPIPASTGNTHRHRLDRAGDRSANNAVYRIALVRMSHDPRSRDYITRTIARGKTKREAIRLLKRAIIRELYPILTT